MRIVVTGRFGQLAQSLREKAAERSGVELVMLGRPELDLARPDIVRAALCDARPDIVVSAAAYTAVDQAEDEADLAYTINAKGAEAVALAARECNAPIIHLSTDYVFSGSSRVPYTEDDPPDPPNVYGKSKLEGERLVAEAYPHHVILRTSWVYGPFGRNFVKTMLRLAEERANVSVVSDQWGNPTSALDLAEAILRVAERLHGNEPPVHGTYHLAGADPINWSGFARLIFGISDELGGPKAKVADVLTRDYPTKALRPQNSRLSCEKFKATFGFELPGWNTSLRPGVQRLLKRG